jgi:hypothetical protein
LNGGGIKIGSIKPKRLRYTKVNNFHNKIIRDNGLNFPWKNVLSCCVKWLIFL